MRISSMSLQEASAGHILCRRLCLSDLVDYARCLSLRSDLCRQSGIRMVIRQGACRHRIDHRVLSVSPNKRAMAAFCYRQSFRRLCAV